jgi:HlyD family secretion protein
MRRIGCEVCLTSILWDSCHSPKGNFPSKEATMKNLLVMLAGLLLVGGAGVSCAQSADDAKPEYQPKLFQGPATAAKNAATASGKNVLATGTIEPEEVVDVGAMVDGPIVSLGADPQSPDKLIGWNSPVEVGTVLAQSYNQFYAIRLQREQAACRRAEAELAKAKINLEGTEAQWKFAQQQQKGGGPYSNYLRAKLAYDLAKPSVAAAEAALAENQAALKEAELNLEHTTIKSPVKGVVVDRRVNVGQLVAAGNTTSSLFLIAKLENLKIWTSVNEADISRIHQQQPVHFTVDACPGKVFQGKVEQIRLNATMAQNVVTYTVVVAVSGTPKELLPYMTANVEFEQTP